MRYYGLSKSKITKFEQCRKQLWLATHRPELAEQNESAEARFDTGHEVGALACAQLAGGILIEAEPDLDAALARTQALLEAGHEGPIFEATLTHDGVVVRIDILEPDGAGGWRMAEVKSSTSAKDYHLGDLATQIWVAGEAGLPVSGAVIRHLDNRFVLTRDSDFNGLFADTDMMAQAEPIIAKRSAVVAAARKTLAGPEPQVEPGPQCLAPFACEFTLHCHSALPATPEWPVSILPHGGGKRWIAQGIDDLFAVPAEALTSDIHRRVHAATVTGMPYHDADGARSAMAAWAFPRSWLDFETINFAVPRWIGTRPYQQVPFQFSVHVELENGTISHHDFLAMDGRDPRRACAEALLTAIPPTGAVIGYNASFERRCVLDLAEAFPDLAERLEEIAQRIVDLLPVTRSYWYHRDQRGSWSIKAVLPTLAGELDYSGLEVKGGGEAQQAFLEAIAPETNAARRQAIAQALKLYCTRDTHAMVVLARHLTGQNT